VHQHQLQQLVQPRQKQQQQQQQQRLEVHQHQLQQLVQPQEQQQKQHLLRKRCQPQQQIKSPKREKKEVPRNAPSKQQRSFSTLPSEPSAPSKQFKVCELFCGMGGTSELEVTLADCCLEEGWALDHSLSASASYKLNHPRTHVSPPLFLLECYCPYCFGCIVPCLNLSPVYRVYGLAMAKIALCLV
jgi:hypothetical protein